MLGNNTMLLWFLVWCMGELFYLAINPIFFDRYSIPAMFVITCLIVTLNPTFKWRAYKFSWVVPVFILTVSILLVKDHMNWQRARWRAITYLTDEMKVPRESIDGGVEFNAWYMTDPMVFGGGREDISAWFVKDDYYLISSKPAENHYSKIKSYDTDQCISSASKKIYILKRNERRKPQQEDAEADSN